MAAALAEADMPPPRAALAALRRQLASSAARPVLPAGCAGSRQARTNTAQPGTYAGVEVAAAAGVAARRVMSRRVLVAV